MRFVAAHDAAQAASDKLPSQAIVVRYLRPDRAAGARVPDAHWHQRPARRAGLAAGQRGHTTLTALAVRSSQRRLAREPERGLRARV
jgi:hypothetical protein